MTAKYINKFELTNKMIDIIHVSSRGQIVIPERVRKHFGIKAGSKLFLVEKDNSLVLKKEEDVAKHLDEDERKEIVGWLSLSEKALKDVWDNPKDNEIWKQYL